jgi:PAS domain-containing protein
MPMHDSPMELSYLRDPRLARYAFSAAPAWLWCTTGRRMIWCNGAAAEALGATTVSALLTKQWEPANPAATEIARLAKLLQSGAPPRSERLMGFGREMRGWRLCKCSRFTLSDYTAAILVVGEAVSETPLPLGDRALRLFEGTGQAIAVFSPDGSLLHATASARAYIGGAQSLADLGAEQLAREALSSGWAAGSLASGYTVFDRFYADGSALLSATFVASIEAAFAASNPDSPSPEPHEVLRFAWQMDVEGRFLASSNELLEIVGPHALPSEGRLWRELNADLGLDPTDAVAQAIATGGTFSAIEVTWPLEDGALRLHIDLSGLPVRNGQGGFLGYRGFGICRDLQRVADNARPLASPDEELAPAPQADHVLRGEPYGPSRVAPASSPRVQERPALALVAAGQNVVPFRAPTDGGLSAIEHRAFNEIGRELSTRLGEAEQTPGWALRSEGAVVPAAEVQEHAASVLPRSEGHEREETRALLDRLPLPVLVYGSALHYANRAFLALADHPDLGSFARAGGLEKLLSESPHGTTLDPQSSAVQTVVLGRRVFDGTTFLLPWDGESAHALVLLERPEPVSEPEAGTESAPPGEQSNSSTAEVPKRPAPPLAAPDVAPRLSSEIRTALNAIIGFAGAMLQESFGPIGNERYRAYLTDIRAASEHALKLLEPLPESTHVSAAVAESGVIDLNDLVRRSVTQFQIEAKLVQVLIRASLLPARTTVKADLHAVRELIADLLIHAIRCTQPGGQVIVSTASVEILGGGADAIALRVRSTGGKLSSSELAAMQNASATKPTDPESAGFALAQARVAVEAIGADFAITLGADSSTVVTVTFPPIPRAVLSSD